MTELAPPPPISSLIEKRPAPHRPDPTWDRCEVVGNDPVGDKYWRLTLRAPSIARRAAAGQFVMITVPAAPGGAAVLPRPMAIHRRRQAKGLIEIVYGLKGGGTLGLTQSRPGSELTVVGPLGVGFDVAPSSGHVLLIGRGIGVCSIMGVAEDAADRGIRVTAILSGRTPEAAIGRSDLEELGHGPGIVVTDADGTSAPENIRSRLRREPVPDQIMVCGSERLARLAHQVGTESGTEVQVALEAHMACGLGYCHGCASAPSTDGLESALICKDGPVFTLPPQL